MDVFITCTERNSPVNTQSRKRKIEEKNRKEKMWRRKSERKKRGRGKIQRRACAQQFL